MAEVRRVEPKPKLSTFEEACLLILVLIAIFTVVLGFWQFFHLAGMSLLYWLQENFTIIFFVLVTVGFIAYVSEALAPTYYLWNLKTGRFHDVGKRVTYMTRTIAGHQFDTLVTTKHRFLYHTLRYIPLLNRLAPANQFLIPYGKWRDYEFEGLKGSPIRPEYEQSLVSLHEEVERGEVSRLRKILRATGLELIIPKHFGICVPVAPLSRQDLLEKIWLSDDEKKKFVKEADRILKSRLLRNAQFFMPPCKLEEWALLAQNIVSLADLEFSKHQAVETAMRNITERVRSLQLHTVSLEGVLGIANELLDAMETIIDTYPSVAKLYTSKMKVPVERTRIVAQELKLQEPASARLIKAFAQARETLESLLAVAEAEAPEVAAKVKERLERVKEKEKTEEKK